MAGFSIGSEAIHDHRAVVLRYTPDIEGLAGLTAKIVPEMGNNLYCFRINEHDVIHYDDTFALTSYYTGNPILYPIPNRCENCRYEFEGRRYWQIKNGIPISMHSLVYDENWAYRPPVVTDQGVSLETYLKVDENHPVYQGFPFRHTLTITYLLSRDGLRLSHRVENEDDKNLPFGISFHTFFSKLSGDDGTKLTVPARYMMELTDALLPTGKLLDVDARSFDLRKPTAVGALDLDNCFTGTEPEAPVGIDYTTIGLRVLMGSTGDYTHVQVFTPPGKPFFCAEKQTSSTDALNLYAKGFRREAHLLIVEPGQRHCGSVDFRYEFYEPQRTQ